MDLNLDKLIIQLVSMLLGSIGTGILWLIKTALKNKSDTNMAFTKIRALEKQVNKLENEK
jgi:hypothetical protein